jgi:hypothetical protein
MLPKPTVESNKLYAFPGILGDANLFRYIVCAGMKCGVLTLDFENIRVDPLILDATLGVLYRWFGDEYLGAYLNIVNMDPQTRNALIAILEA